MMKDSPFLMMLRALLGDQRDAEVYPCIQDLVDNGLTIARFSSEDRMPSRQDVTQYMAAWCKHAGLVEEACRGWLIEYCVAMLSSISTTSVSGIRHSTKSNVKYIYRDDFPFVCGCEENPFKARCSKSCPAYAAMQARLTEKKSRPANMGYEVERPARVMQTQSPSVKEVYRDQFEEALCVIRRQIEKGTKRKAIIDLLNERGMTTRTGRKWTYSILQSEMGKVIEKRVS